MLATSFFVYKPNNAISIHRIFYDKKPSRRGHNIEKRSTDAKTQNHRFVEKQIRKAAFSVSSRYFLRINKVL